MIKENNPPGNPSQPPTSLRDILSLPKYSTLGSLNLVIEVIRDDQMTEMFSMINEAMQHGHGYGVDEYKSEGDFLEEINGGPCFAVMNTDSGKMLAGFALSHSKYYRGSEYCAIDPIIIVRKSERGKGLGEYVFQSCIDFSKALDYGGVYADTFVNNVAMIKIIEKRHPSFQKVGMLPLGGRMPDGTVVGMNLYYMDLTSTTRTTTTTATTTATVITTDDNDNIDDNAVATDNDNDDVNDNIDDNAVATDNDNDDVNDIIDDNAVATDNDNDNASSSIAE